MQNPTPLQQALYQQEMLKQAAIYEAQQTEDLFEAAFNNHIAKLAAADPEYAAILEMEQAKTAAFQYAYEATLAQYGVQVQ